MMSNCDEVELFVNGRSAGRLAPNSLMNLPHPMTVFENALELGEMTVVGYINGEKAAEHTVRTPGKR